MVMHPGDAGGSGPETGDPAAATSPAGTSTAATSPEASYAPARPVEPLVVGPEIGAASPRKGLHDLATRLGRDARALATPRGMYGAAVETAWGAAHLAMYPFGILHEREQDWTTRFGYEHLSVRQRSLVASNVEAAGTPILMVHGLVDNRAIFAVLNRRLKGHGFERVVTFNYSPVTNDIRAAAAGLAVQVEALIARTGYERIHIVGHSLGGLIARYYVQRLGGDERVHTLVTLGAPHHGSLAAHLIPVQLGRQLRPNSDLFTELDQPAPGIRTRFVCFWSDIDQLIVPHDNARLRHPDLVAHNELARGVGHLSLPVDSGVVSRVSQVLGELNADGSSLSAGVVPLHRT